MLAWNARLSVEVPCVSNAVKAVTLMTDMQGGLISDQTDGGKQTARLTLRIPAAVLHETLAEIEGLAPLNHGTST